MTTLQQAIFSMSTTCTVPSTSASAPAAPVQSRLASMSRGGAVALAIRLAGAGGMFLSQVVLARSLGVTGFGEYALAVAWMQSLVIVAKLGLDNGALRFVAEYSTTGDRGKMRSFLRESDLLCLSMSLLVSLGLVATTFVCWQRMSSGLAGSLLVAAAMIPLVTMRQLTEFGLRAVGRILESQISLAIWPVLLFAMTAIVWLGLNVVISPIQAMLFHLASMLIVGVMVYRFRRHSPLTMSAGPEYESCRRLWLTTSAAFLLYELLIILKSRCCVALAGLMLGNESAGLYAAMERIAEVSILGSASLSMVIAPQFSSLYAAGRYHEMRKLVRYGEILGLAFTIPVALIVACGGEYVLALFGDDYQAGWTVLMTLLGSAVIGSFSGPGAYVLHMTGWERTNLLITLACTVTNLALSFALMPSLGVVGLGVAQMATSAVWMIGVRVSLRRHPAWLESSLTGDAPSSSGGMP